MCHCRESDSLSDKFFFSYVISLNESCLAVENNNKLHPWISKHVPMIRREKSEGSNKIFTMGLLTLCFS